MIDLASENLKKQILNASAYQYQLSVQEKFTEICQPLFKLGIKYFVYMKIFEDGRFLHLTNHLAYCKDYLLRIDNFGNILSKFYSSIHEKSYFLLPYDQKGKDDVIDTVIHHTIWNAFNIYKKSSSGYLTAHCFANDFQDPLFSGFYLKNICVLEHFCNYFDEKAKDLIDCKDQTKLSFKQKVDFLTVPETDILAQKIDDFLRETFIKKYTLKVDKKDVLLSCRETECLNFLALGKTAKEIAKYLDLSPRTVEFYLQNIRKKSGLKRQQILTGFSSNSLLTVRENKT